TVEKEGRSGTQSYRYDAEHRMVEVTTARGTYRYVYDALGRRTEKQHISPDGKPYNRTAFLWDGMRLAQESRPEGISSLYIYSDPGSYEPLARVDKAGKEGPNRILYFHTDVNGAPEEMTDSDGKIVWETGYQVWGNTIQEKDHGGVEQNLRYQGQYLDRETGLHYNLHRYYDPDVGRFMVTDPIGLKGGINLYQYAPNPLSYIDPFGLFTCGVNWKKGPNKWAKGKLSKHYNKHVLEQGEFGDISMKQYHELMEDFLMDNSPSYKYAKIGNHIIKFDPATERVLIGNAKNREILTFYKSKPEFVKKDPFTDAVDEALSKTGMSPSDVQYK
ncbi:RHS repeat domain-containing protein, partial [Escherichia coli]